MAITVPEITIYDRIQIKKEFILNEADLQQFIYRVDESFESTIEEDEEHYYLGVGCLDRIHADNIIDRRITKKINEPIKFIANLVSAQQATLDLFKNGSEITSGILKAKCGWGKSLLGTKLTCDSQDTTIILVHTKLLLDQWYKLFKSCTNYEPGIIGDGTFNPRDVTIGLYISVNNNLDLVKNNFSEL